LYEYLGADTPYTARELKNIAEQAGGDPDLALGILQSRLSKKKDVKKGPNVFDQDWEDYEDDGKGKKIMAYEAGIPDDEFVGATISSQNKGLYDNE
jgi:hypothetical protein